MMFSFQDMMYFGMFVVALLAYLDDRNNRRK